MSLPVPKEVSDQVHIDLLEEWDCQGARYYIVHMIDHASRFQMGQVLPNKSTASVVNFIKTRWLPVFGPPRVMVADQGKEFVSWEFEQLCSENSILLWHCAVQALGKMDFVNVEVAFYVQSWEHHQEQECDWSP